MDEGSIIGSLRLRADALNSKRFTQEMVWWYYVRRLNGTHVVDKLEGAAAEEARSRYEGDKVVPYVPNPKDLESINQYVRQQMDNGLSQDEFNALVRRSGGAPVVGELL